MEDYDYTTQFLSLRKIVNAVDPIEIIGICPIDEYDPEVRDILSLIATAKSSKQLATMNHGVFSKWFSEDIAGPPDNYLRMAKLIWKNRDKF